MGEEIVLCQNCGSPCHVLSGRERDGNKITIEAIYCEHADCSLRGRNQLHYGEEGLRETEFGADWDARYTAFGPPSQNEENTLPTSQAFVLILQRDYSLSVGDPELVDQKNDYRIDARSAWGGGGWLSMQITRALPGSDYREQAQYGEVDSKRTTSTAVDLIRKAIEKKSRRAREDITLLIDGRHAVDLAFPAPTLFFHEHGRWARDEGWESIWVVGPSFAKRLDDEGLPLTWR